MNSTGVELTAGLGGFLVVFALGLAVWVLGRDLTRRLRRMRLREEERLAALRQDAAEAPRAGGASGAAGAAGAAPTSGPAAGPRPDEPDPLA